MEHPMKSPIVALILTLTIAPAHAGVLTYMAASDAAR